MKFNFRKIASVIASAVMLGSTLGTALAATYPSPFVVGGTADGAIVVTSGTHAGASVDWDAAVGIKDALQGKVTTTTTTATISGEATPLFSGGTKLYMNDSLNAVKTILTKSELPTVLKDGSFSGNVDASITFTIQIGSNPKTTYNKQPTSSDDPLYALTTSTTQANYIYNAIATFNKAVNLSHADSKGETLTLFGQPYTIAAATTQASLVLLKSAAKVSLSSDANPSQEVTIEGKKYTVELVSTSDTAATIKVTDDTGASESKEINEAASKKVQGITIAVINADENNLKLTASIVAGSDKVTLTDGSSITRGEDDTTIDGTNVEFSGTEDAKTDYITKIAVNITAPNSDSDAIKPGTTFVDPVFGNFKLDFVGLNIPSENTTAREEIKITPNGDDKMDVNFADSRGTAKTITWAKNTTGAGTQLMHDDDGRNITVMERQNIYKEEYVVVGNEAEGYLLKLTNVKNETTGTSNDRAEFTDIFGGDTLKTVWTGDGVGTLAVGGRSYNVYMDGNQANASEEYIVKLDYPDSAGNASGDAVVYPTIQTSKGAKLAFYEPLTINFTGWYENGFGNCTGGCSGGAAGNLQLLKFPDGDGYTDVTVSVYDKQNVSVDAGVTNLSGASNNTLVTVGELKYSISYVSMGKIKINLLEADGNGNINRPALVIFEEKDDNAKYEAQIVELEDGQTGDDGIGVDSIESTWDNGGTTWQATMASDSKKKMQGDLWGMITTIDSSDSGHNSGLISYPDEQINSQIYVGANEALVTGGTTGGAGGTILVVKDTEVASVSNKNLIVVGGSCINSVAAKILGSDTPICGADFTTKTSVDAGKYLIQAVASPYNSAKTAVLIAGYEAAETKNAALKLQEGAVTDVGTKIVGPTVA